jgi:uncharacterized protein
MKIVPPAVDAGVETEPGLNGNALSLPHGFTLGQINAAITPSHQKLTLFPTEKCNFRCTYCYEDFEIGRMSDELQRSIEIFLERRVSTLKSLQFSWFGGEPLLAKDVVLRLMKHAKHLCDDNGILFSSGMTTNAYLLEYDLAEELLSLNQDFYQITLDGIGDTHDILRRRADGAGTFDRIWKNLVAMKELQGNFDCMLRIHVRRDNIDNLKLLMAEIRREFGADRRYRLDFQHLRDMGGEGGRSVVAPLSLSELEDVKAVLLELYFSGSTSLFRPMEVPNAARNTAESPSTGNTMPLSESAGSRRLSELSSDEPYICYAAKPNNLIIRANGRIGKCTVALDDERNDLGYLDANGQLVLDHDKHKLWYRGIETLDLDTVSCPINDMPLYEGKIIVAEQPIRWSKTGGING